MSLLHFYSTKKEICICSHAVGLLLLKRHDNVRWKREEDNETD